MKRHKLLFLGQGETAAKTLKLLNKEPCLEIVFCAPRMSNDSYFDEGILARKCDELGINKLKSNDVNSVEFTTRVKDQGIDLIVNLGHHQLFQRILIDSSKFGVLNYHPGLLPYGRGSGALVGEIMNGSTEIGRTCHLVDEHFDRGLIVKQEKFNISGNSTMVEASNIVQTNVDVFIRESVLCVFNEEINKSESNYLGFGRYFPKFADGDDYIDWNSTSKNIHNKIRARLDERPAVFYTKDLDKYLVTKSELAHDIDDYIAVNGQVIDRTENGVLVKTSDTAIWINEILDPKTNQKSVPKFKIGTCFQTINISDFVTILQKLNNYSNNFMSRSFDDLEVQELDSLFHCPSCGEKRKSKISQTVNTDYLVCKSCNYLYIP